MTTFLARSPSVVDDIIGEPHSEPHTKKNTKQEPALDPEFSDFNLARSVMEFHGSTVRHLPQFDTTYWWSGTHWQEDLTAHVPALVRDHLHMKSLLVDSPKKKLLLQSRAKINNVLALVKMDQKITITMDAMNTQDFELNTPSGTIDLHTLKLMKHDPRALHSMITAVSPSFEPPELFLQFLSRVTDGDQEKQEMLQRWAGYCLSGSTRERCMIFQYGSGQNGKGTLVNALAGSMGTYARPVADEVFTYSKFPVHSTGIAGLRGVRLAFGDETQAGSAWDEAKIKKLTGGGTITAHLMCQDYQDFVPKFKLMVSGNNKPALTAVDEAIRSRMILLPFTVTIPEADRDRQLEDKLRDEYPRILGWALEGCHKWHQDGLRIPESVKDATQEYLSGEDTLGRWMAERAVLGPLTKYEASPSHLFQDWKTWCEQSNEKAGSQKAFSIALEKRDGVKKDRDMHGRRFQGIALKCDTAREE